jgi:hypothetical protein
MTRSALAAFALGFAALDASPADPLLDALEASYHRIRTVSCEVERVTEGAQGRLKLLSRVFYQEGGRLHVENVRPGRRRIVCDGRALWLKDDAFQQGFSGPLAELRGQEFWRDQIERIPGTPSEHIRRARAQNLTGRLLPAADGVARRTAYAAEKTHLVISQDERDRIVALEYFRDPELQDRAARFEYAEFKDFPDGISVAQLHRAWLRSGADEITETTRFLNLAVNEPVAASLFDAARHFPGVSFHDDFSTLK